MRVTPAMVLVPVAALLGFLLLFDHLSPSEATSIPPPLDAGEAVSGSWYCAAGDTNEGRTTSVVFAPVPSDDMEPTDVIVSTFGAGERDPGSETRVLPEDVRVDELPPGRDSIGVAARWWGRPAVLSRVWRVGGSDFPSGWVAGPCEPSPSINWFVPGLSTDGGGQAQLILANPFDSSATATVTLATSEGLLQPRRLGNLHVPDGDVLRIELNEFAPEQADLGVIVRVRAGRLVAEGVQSFNAAIGGVDGVTLVKAAPATALSWTIPWVEVADRVGSDEEGDEDGVDSWVWVTNPSTEAAEIELTLHTDTGTAPPVIGSEDIEEPAAPATSPPPDSGSPTATPSPVAQPSPGPPIDLPDPEAASETLRIEPGAVRRIDVAELLPGGTGVAGVTVTSTNDVPIVVSAGTIRRDPAAVLSALAIQIAAPLADTTWVWSVPPPADRATHLHVVNLGDQPATLDVRYHVGDGQIANFSAQVIVPVGALADVDLSIDVGDAEQLTVYVGSDQPIVAGYRSLNTEGRPDLVLGLGAAGHTWQGGGQVPRAVHRPELVRQLGTSGQPATMEEPTAPDLEFDAPTEDRPSPSPSPSPSGSPTTGG
ncbi:MAG: DUF5719 family protein [Nitriliruptorales bacterium]|nr:DUF5719 family protein [Nitriliruptorales bacterium]